MRFEVGLFFKNRTTERCEMLGTPRGFARPNLLCHDSVREVPPAHQPLNRQSERYRREGIDLSVSTLAAQVGSCTTVLQPLHALIEFHVLAAERPHGDDTTVPILAKGKTVARRSSLLTIDVEANYGCCKPGANFARQ
jgi:Transposase IS66 family